MFCCYSVKRGEGEHLSDPDFCSTASPSGRMQGYRAHEPESQELELLPQHRIFLSHSGAQKPFVEQLCLDLENAGQYPFFDRRPESLPKGDKFLGLILRAARQCHVAVVVLSKNYLMSKWPMLESKISELEQELEGLRSHKGESQDTVLAQLQIESAESKVRELEDLVRTLEEESASLREEAQTHAERAKSHEETATVHLTDKEMAIQALEYQRSRLQRAERGLQIAEAAMLKAKAEAEEKSAKLDELHQSWLPPWAATHADTLQKTASSRWSTHGEPVVKNFQKSASTKAADAHEYIKPHLDTFHTTVNPVIREKWQKLGEAVAPHLETVKKVGISSREYIAPHVETVQKTVNPYVQAAKEKSKPYVDQATTFAAPHLERVNTLAGPHYRRALTAANTYHEQVQRYLEEHLGKYEFLTTFLTKESVWFLAAAILALPFMLAFMFLRKLFAPRVVVHHKRHRSSHSGSSSNNKKPRRSRQADKMVEK